MIIRNSGFMSYEINALLEALRRDLRIELVKAKTHSGHAAWHQANVRMNIRILEALNPKRQGPHISI